MKKKKSRKLKTQLRILICAVVIACTLVVGFCLFTTRQLLQSTDDFFAASDALDDFYNYAEAMNLLTMEYFVAPDNALYHQYQSMYNLALECVATSQDYLGESASWRMIRLGNMLESYDDEFAAVRDDFTYATYLDLGYLGGLIQKTYEQYHTILLADMEERNGSLRAAAEIQLTVSLAIIVGTLFSSYFILGYFQRKISTPITQMAQNVNLIGRGEFTLEPVVGASAELHILSTAFLKMADAIENNFKLIQYSAQQDKRLLEQENETLQMKNNLVQMELKNLQTQINPHFLFNTLNLISKKALLHGEGEISLLMEQTASLLRYSLDKTNKISTLYEEIECIRNYSHIQQSRFEGRMIFTLEVQEQLPNIPMPAMVLQPMLENSVIHGLKDMMQGAEVSVRMSMVDGKIRICMEDNGVGLPSAKFGTPPHRDYGQSHCFTR